MSGSINIPQSASPYTLWMAWDVSRETEVGCDAEPRGWTGPKGAGGHTVLGEGILLRLFSKSCAKCHQFF